MITSKSRYFAYVGTYTHGDSEGIYVFTFDALTGLLEPVGVSKKLENPSYLALDKDNKYLYTVMETDKFNGEKGGAVGSFSIDKMTGNLKFLNCHPTKGRAPCHISIDKENKYLFAANYSEGTVALFPINSDGSISPVSDVIYHEGCGPNKERQEKPHAHYVSLTPEEEYLCAVDLGIDKVMVYRFDKEKGKLTPLKNLSPKIKPGSGPRHMVFHPNGNFAYVINELSSDIVVFKYNSPGSSLHCSPPASLYGNNNNHNSYSGNYNQKSSHDSDYGIGYDSSHDYPNCIFEEIQYISTLPDEYKNINYCSAIHMDRNGKYLYASNRGHDSIAIFKADEISGKLQPIAHTPTGGNFPRDFAIDPTGNFLFAANQNSDTIVPFKILPESGKLEQIGHIINVPAPVCIKFAEFM
jgi:6-phosphogluconolactonase